jgi:hypothetical protein
MSRWWDGVVFLYDRVCVICKMLEDISMDLRRWFQLWVETAMTIVTHSTVPANLSKRTT